MDDQAEPAARARGRPAEHLVVAVGVAEGHDRPAADVPLDAHRLARPVVDEIDLGEPDERRLGRSRSSYLILIVLPMTCSGGMP